MKFTSDALCDIAMSPFVPASKDPYSRISKIHKYWSRKPWSVIDHFLETFSNKDALVLDPFCGSGVIGLEAIKLGRVFHGSDLNPFAVRLTSETVSGDFDEERFKQAIEYLRRRCMDEIETLYQVGDSLVLYSCPNASPNHRYNAYLQLSKSMKPIKSWVDLSQLPQVSFKASDDSTLPDQDFPEKFYKDRFSSKGIRKVSQLFSERNLRALSILRRGITQVDPQVRNHLDLCLTNTLLHVSKLKSEKVRPLGVNNYWIPDDFIEENVWWRFMDRCKQYSIAKKVIKSALSKSNAQVARTEVRLADATNLAHLQSDSIDYILTDPPYGDAIQYSELSFVWNCWLGEHYVSEREIIINPEQNKDHVKYSGMLEQFLVEASRVLKIDCPMTISFHSKDVALWCELAASLFKTGFVLDDLFVAHGVGSPFTKNWASFSPKSDIYITVRNRRLLGRKLNFASGPDFINSIQLSSDNHSPKSYQTYDFLILAVVNEVVNGTYLSGLKKATMALLAKQLAVCND